MNASHPADIRRDHLRAAALFAFCVLAVGMALEYRSLIDHDVAFQLYAAKDLLNGAQLYTDIFEFNLPPAYYLYLPAAWLSETLGTDPFATHRSVLAGIAVIAGLSVAGFASRLPGALANRRFIVFGALLAFALVFYISTHFGQREHFLLLLLLPYVLLRVTEDTAGVMPALWLLVLIGAAAGFAVTVKPPQVLVPICLEIWRAWRLRRLPLDACNIAMALVGAAMLAEFLIYHYGDYFELLPLTVATSYFSASTPRAFLLAHIDSLPALALMIALLTLPAQRLQTALKPGYVEPLRRLAVAALAALGAGIVQQKFYNYHFLPWQALSTIWLGIALLGLLPAPAKPGKDMPPATPATAAPAGHGKLARRWRIGVTTGLALVVFTGLAHVPLRDIGKYNRHGYFIEKPFDRHLADAAGEGLMFLSPSITPNFYIALKYDLNWASRFPYIWPLTLMANGRICHEDEEDCRKPEVAVFLRQTIATDLMHACPEHVVVLESGFRPYGWGFDFSFDTIAFFSENPDFERLWRNYVLAESATEENARRVYRLYENVTGQCG